MKAKLVIDMPITCDDCPLCHYHRKFMVIECRAGSEPKTLKHPREKPDWCPLEEVDE